MAHVVCALSVETELKLEFRVRVMIGGIVYFLGRVRVSGRV